MSIVDHFERNPSAGFMRHGLARQANRQFRISVALVIVLALAALSVSFSVWAQSHVETGSLVRILAMR